MRTLQELENELVEAEREAASLRKKILVKQGLTSDQKLAEYLHKKFCSSDHTDGCSWSYEENNWNQYAHTRWLKNALEVRAEVFRG